MNDKNKLLLLLEITIGVDVRNILVVKFYFCQHNNLTKLKIFIFQKRKLSWNNENLC